MPLAVVTGASVGIGRAVVLGVARDGYDIAFTYRARAPYRDGRASFARALRHFRDCVVAGVPCRTPPERAVADQILLRDFYRLAERRTGAPMAP